METVLLTKSEQKTFDILLKKSGRITSRDEIAQNVWGKLWLQKYSDWQIDRLIYLLRRKISSHYNIRTLRNSGYLLFPKGLAIPSLPPPDTTGTVPTQEYLEYMNNPKNKRRTLKDLFKNLPLKISAQKILVVNSFSADNVSAVFKQFPQATTYFSNFDLRALEIHQEKINELNARRFSTVLDDLRQSLFRNNFFDLIINDFRLNFNTNHRQNLQAMASTFRILKPRGKVLVSVVVDGRFESPKYGCNQEKAPLNKYKPWTFKAQENLPRFCFTVPYYCWLFKDCGFQIGKEFDLKNGQSWILPYRRFLLKKI